MKLFSSNLNVEEQRITKAEKAIASVANQYDSLIEKFSSELKATKNHSEGLALIEEYASKLWQRSSSDNQKAKHSFDDRPLYWARLKMAKAIKANQLSYALSTQEYQSLFLKLERASRGQLNAQFSEQATKKVLITGFDPFFLDRNIAQSNPSGLAALLLDGKKIQVDKTVIEIQSAIFPVRFEDFDQGEVEIFLKPFLKRKSVDMIVTISMGRNAFDLERFPGLRRSAKAPGNLNIYTGASKEKPLIPLQGEQKLKGPEFVEFTLPVEAMRTIQEPFKVNDRRKITTTVKSFEADSLDELKGVISVEGSGGGYLSNEISYRSINLGNKLNAKIPTGHLHTPRINGYEPEIEKQIVDQIERIIVAGVTILD